ncbi:MAG: NAD(P)/FAD-dependent oxidoreductase [Candidatus Marinimicrobia bacterium]|nr:NAD(P)/FAD-dependent oxidoreductase [Candidatus Neomarinimicrobiota bacterium]
MKNDFSIIIIGAGVVGLSIARSLALKGQSNILIIEKEDHFGKGISSRNSEVIHSGIYYPPNSLKADLCTQGRDLLYDYCDSNQIWYSRCGKLVIAHQGQEEELAKLYLNAQKNHVPELEMIHKENIQLLEPSINAETALFIGCTGIIDAHALMTSLKRESDNADHNTLYKTKVTGAKTIESGYEISIENAMGEIEIATSDWVVNASGLESDHLARFIAQGERPTFPELQYSKGDYFKLSSKWRNHFTHLIYPLPDKRHDSLGIHLSFDQLGNTKLGPSAHWQRNRDKDYQVDSTHLDYFFDEGFTYIPELKKEDLSPDFSGIRPKIKTNDHSFSDFYISHEDVKGFPGWINLIGIDSPGLTSSLAIGEKVAQIVHSAL